MGRVRGKREALDICLALTGLNDFFVYFWKKGRVHFWKKGARPFLEKGVHPFLACR
jgi:hypothetical protein